MKSLVYRRTLILGALALVSSTACVFVTDHETDDPARRSEGRCDVYGEDRCDGDQFCDDRTCGGADARGTCEPVPEACDDIYEPVCGCDGNTYGNSCYANMAGVPVADEGTCDEPSADCGGFLGLPCGDDEFCEFAVDDQCGAADQLGTCATIPEACIEIADPVCGCDGNTYGNACFANMAGTSVASEGACP